MGPKKSPSRKSKSKEPTPDPEQQNQPSTSGLGDKGGDEGGVKRKDMNAGKTSSKAQGEKGAQGSRQPGRDGRDGSEGQLQVPYGYDL